MERNETKLKFIFNLYFSDYSYMYSCYHPSPSNRPNYHSSWQCHPPIGTYSTISPSSPIRNNESGMFQSLTEPIYRESFDKESIMNECKKLIVNPKISTFKILLESPSI